MKTAKKIECQYPHNLTLVFVDGDPDVMTLVRESCVIKPIGSGNRLRKKKPVDLTVEDHVADANGNLEPTKSSSPTRTKNQDLSSRVNELKDSLATLARQCVKYCL